MIGTPLPISFSIDVFSFILAFADGEALTYGPGGASLLHRVRLGTSN